MVINPIQNPLAIEIQGLNKKFGRTSILHNLDLKVEWGQVLTILGPNGSGKTTLIKILSTLSQADSGRILISGRNVMKDGKNIRRILGVVSHNNFLYDSLSAHENLRFYGRIFNLSQLEYRIKEVTKLMGVSQQLDQRVGTLSHGTRKRIDIARAILHKPSIILMDEPESGLDQEALAMLENIMSETTDPLRTIIKTTHNLERGLIVGHQVAILSEGKVTYHDSINKTDISAIKDTYLKHTKQSL